MDKGLLSIRDHVTVSGLLPLDMQKKTALDPSLSLRNPGHTVALGRSSSAMGNNHYRKNFANTFKTIPKRNRENHLGLGCLGLFKARIALVQD